MDFWDLTIRFFSLTDANVRWVVAGSILLGGAAGGLGSFVYLQKRSLLGDTLAHAALPGVCLAFLLVGRKEFIALLLGAATTGWLGALAVNYIVTHTKLKLDAALGIVLTSFFGLGIVMLTHIQKSGSGAQSGLDKFLFGQAAVMSQYDVTVLAIVAAVLLVTVLIWFNRFMLISFDLSFAASIGLRVGWLQFILGCHADNSGSSGASVDRSTVCYGNPCLVVRNFLGTIRGVYLISGSWFSDRSLDGGCGHDHLCNFYSLCSRSRCCQSYASSFAGEKKND